MDFTQKFWKNINNLLTRIFSHPFLLELANGTLSSSCFLFYLQQDSLYLQDFSKALSLLAAKMPSRQSMEMILNFTQGALVAEQTLHQHYFSKYASISNTIERSPTCQAYGDFLLKSTALCPVEVGMAAVLPCFWIYQAVGERLLAQLHTSSSISNPYQDWIETYASEEFKTAVAQAISLTETLAQQTTELIRDNMSKAFLTAARYEWLFWDSAYRLEEWP